MQYLDGTGAWSYSPRYARKFSAAGTYVSIGTSTDFNQASPTKFTVRMWFKPTVNVTNGGLSSRVAQAGGQGDFAAGFFNGGSMKPTFRVNNNGGSIQSNTTLQGGHWYFLEFSDDSSLVSNNLKLFIDGALDTQGTYTTAITNNSNPLWVGMYNGTANGAPGVYSEYELAIGVIRNTSAYTPPKVITPDSYTKAYYKMSEDVTGSPTTVTDSSGNAHTGTLVVTGVSNDMDIRIP